MTKPWESYQGIYIHIPFCVQKCNYCDFASYKVSSRSVMEQYINRLVEEIGQKKVSLPVDERATIYFGGGTPSILPVFLLEKIVNALKERKLWKTPKEVTLEANPGTVNTAKLQAYRAMGIDRLSLGIQSFQDDELCTMGRIHTAEKAKETIAMAREAGFLHCNGDLIYGYPGQTVERVEDSLAQLIATGVDHISVYGLTVEKGTLLEKQLAAQVLQLPDEEAAGDMYDCIIQMLQAAGYVRYEISNFARPGHASRHNQVYWHYNPYLAFGAAATGFDGKNRFTNPSRVQDYINGKATAEEVLTNAEREEELVLMNLRTAKGLSLTEFNERVGKNFRDEYGPALAHCLAQGWVTEKGGRICPTAQGMRYGNLLFESFLQGS